MATRDAILRSWQAARRQAESSGAVTLTAASFAGFALDRAGGDATRAHDLVPTAPGSFWARTHDALDQVTNEERLAISDDRADFADECAQESKRARVA